ncbi:MAG: general stress protein [Myxococcota bacterium]|nr:general stress protein [Myxococcota bacterium]
MFTHVSALFADRHAARAAVEQLVQAGFSRPAISVMMSAMTHEREFGDAASERARLAGRFQGVLNSIVAGVVLVTLPNGFVLRAAGPLASGLARSMKRTDALHDALASAGLVASEARFVDEGVRRGSIVLGVRASRERARLAGQLLELSGGASLQAA